MSNIWTIAKREYKYYFTSPVAYVVAIIVLLVIGALFSVVMNQSISSFGQSQPPEVSIVTGPLIFMLVFACPALTMRLVSEEIRQGTMELLLTAPIRDWELVVGKWLGAFLFVLTLVAVTFVYPVALNLMVKPGIDQGPLVTGYLGVLLISAAFLGIGVAISALFNNQVAAYLATFGLLVMFWWILNIFSTMGAASANPIFKYMDFSSHFYDTLIRGVIELSDIVYLTSMTVLALFLGSVFVEMRRWK